MAKRMEAVKAGECCTDRTTKSWSCTELKKATCLHTWVISDFSLRQEQTGTYIESPAFSASAPDAPQWCLRLFPNGNTQKNKENVALFLTPWRDCDVNAKFELWIVNASGGKSEAKVVPVHKFARGEDWGYASFVARRKLLDPNLSLLVDDSLTVCCEVTSMGDDKVSSFVESYVVPEFRLHNDLADLYASGKFSDVTIVAEGERFRVHKAILAARSPVLAAMLEHHMEETKQNRIVIEDVSAEVIGQMLLFMYTGTAPKLEAMASDLLVAADKYDLERLKMMCGEHLFSNLSAQNAVDLLILVDRHNLSDLKTRVLRYINAKATGVVGTAGWKRMVKEQPRIMAEIIAAQLPQHSSGAERHAQSKK